MVYKIALMLAVVLVLVLVVPSMITNLSLLTKTIRNMRNRPYRRVAR
jgi:hypothetical protein